MTRGDGLTTCLDAPARAYDVALLDLDGVVHLVDDPVPGAAEALAAARAAGQRLAFVTNNASRTREEVVARLARWGIPASLDDVVTAGQAAARLVAEQVPAGARVLVLGTGALEDSVRAVGLVPVRRADEEPAAVVQGLDRELRYADLVEAALALGRGVPWVAANTDSTLPTSRGRVPGNGALVAALAVATGRQPVAAGKPEPALHAESVRRTGAVRPLVVGDRLDTDVLGAVRGGADSMTVLTGVLGLPELLAAPTGNRPGLVAGTLAGLLVPHPPVTTDGSTATCAEATARRDGADLVLSVAPAAGRPPATVPPPADATRATVPAAAPDLALAARQVAALRVLCAAAWAGPPPGAVTAAGEPAAALLEGLRALHPG